MLRRLIWFLDFYSMFAAATLVITLVCGGLLYSLQAGMKPFVYIFWFKVITLGICMYGAYRYRGNKFYYYKNLGISIPALWISSGLVDFLIFVGVIVMVIKYL